jgi:hypothetical protein
MPDIRKRTFIDTTKHNVFIAINFIFISILFGYGIYQILFGYILVGIAEVIASLVLYGSLFLFIKKITFLSTIIMSMSTFYVMSLFLFISGGIHRTGIYWLFIIPIVYFFFLGLKGGVVLFLAQLLSIAVIFLLSLRQVVEIPYDRKTIMLFLVISLCELIILISHEIILQKYRSEIKVMSGLLPICSHCKKIRDDEGYWNRIETYIETHSEAHFSHGLCQECEKKLYGGEEWYLHSHEKEGP